MNIKEPTAIIYIQLLNEGTYVMRPTRGLCLGGNVYEVLPTEDYDPQDETWEFEPGTIVRCSTRVVEGTPILVATGKA